MPTRLDPFTPGTIGHAALSYAHANLKIFPLWWPENGTCACADHEKCGSPGKHPLIPHGVLAASSDPDQVRKWWSTWPRANIGLPAGANELAILDVDNYHGGEASISYLTERCMIDSGVDLWATRLVRTGSGSSHLYYREPAGGIKSAAGSLGYPGVDTRGRGGYVVAPPSLHACGGVYERIQNGFRLAPWPDFLTTLMDRHARPAPPAEIGPDCHDGAARGPQPVGNARLEHRLRAWAAAGHRRECDHLRGLPDSGGNRRNYQLNQAAYRSGLKYDAGLLPSRTAIGEDLYQATIGWTGHTQREIMATIRSGLDGARGRAGTLRLPPWASGYTITSRG